MSQVLIPQMMGARHAGALRRDDFCPTSPIAVEALCNVEKFHGEIWEPACGDGAISRVLDTLGYHVISSDLVDRGFGEPRVDFLMEQAALAPNIITNPPFKLGEQFARHAIRLGAVKVALLMRLGWLASQSRRSLFEETCFARTWVFSSRLPMMHRGDYEGPKSGSAIDFAWFVWDRTHKGPPTLGWLP